MTFSSMLNKDKICKIDGCNSASLPRRTLCGHHRYEDSKKIEDINRKKGKICKIDECDRGSYVEELCRNHYNVIKRKQTEENNRKKGKICKIDGCDRGTNSKGYCQNHYGAIAYKKIRDLIFKHLGQNKCQMCGFRDKRAFTLDHIHDDGYIDKKNYKSEGGIPIFKKYAHDPELARKKLQVLCMNCNFIKEVERKKRINGNPDLIY